MTDPISRASVTMAKCTQAGPAVLVAQRRQSSYAQPITDAMAAAAAAAPKPAQKPAMM
jgi:hypothetical protein